MASGGADASGLETASHLERRLVGQSQSRGRPAPAGPVIVLTAVRPRALHLSVVIWIFFGFFFGVRWLDTALDPFSGFPSLGTKQTSKEGIQSGVKPPHSKKSKQLRLSMFCGCWGICPKRRCHWFV